MTKIEQIVWWLSTAVSQQEGPEFQLIQGSITPGLLSEARQ